MKWERTQAAGIAIANGVAGAVAGAVANRILNPLDEKIMKATGDDWTFEAALIGGGIGLLLTAILMQRKWK